MKTRTRRSRPLEQLEMFGDDTLLPTWSSLAEKAKEQIRELIAGLLVDHIQDSGTSIDCKEVVHERQN
jgi:hypothetical protein